MTKSLVPVARIIINDNPLPIDVESKTGSISIKVSEDLEAPAMFTLEIIGWDLIQSQANWIDNDKYFGLGNKIEIKLGYNNQQESLIVGEITGLEPEFTSDEAILTVRGHNHSHRLLRGNKTQTFINITDSQIAKKIAEQQKLKFQTEDTKEKLDHVIQSNQSDLDFLQSRAERIGYEVFVENETLYFRSIQEDSQTILTLDLNEDLIQFSPRLSTMEQVGEIEVRSWNPLEKKLLVAKAGVGDEKTTMGGKTSGAKAVKIFGKTSYIYLNSSIKTEQEAKKVAEALFNEMTRSYITGEGTCIGNPKLRVGKVIEVTGVGERFSGFYYVTETTHSYSESEGYQTEFSFERNAT
ncbi:phage late control D family protein [Mastigocoleus testarum]|uniref:Phage late control D family protein n=1 Tax=Mastigocoleus testarum BC008 TaxID=371196 RepID=A0A0V7ZVG3_9CYAN|nr:contractile injection system protein, VgrG/Pvc8 family [Mastigocoleus testarum]KST68644.1 hypothetical protein BC008_33915 [Mastigocoleus testarum BC008]